MNEANRDPVLPHGAMQEAIHGFLRLQSEETGFRSAMREMKLSCLYTRPSIPGFDVALPEREETGLALIFGSTLLQRASEKCRNPDGVRVSLCTVA